MDENYYKKIIEQTTTGYAYHKINRDESGKLVDFECVEINSVFERTLGALANLGDLVKGSFPLWTEDVDLVEFYKEAEMKQEPKKIKFHLEILNGWYTLEVHWPQKDHCISVLKEITECKLLEEKLHECQRSKLAIISNLPGMVYRCRWDDEWTMEYISEGVHELTGYQATDFLYNNKLSFNDIIAPDYREHLRKIWDEQGSSKKPVHLEYPIITAQNQEKWVMEHGLLIFNEKEQTIEIEGIVMDITSLKATEKILTESEEKFRTILMSVGDGVISTDINGNVLTMNIVAESLTGWKQDEAFGLPLKRVFHIVNEFTREPHENLIEKVFETGSHIKLSNHVMLISKDGTERSIEDNVAPIKNERGTITGVVMVFRDFTEKKEKQEEIMRLSFYDQLTGIHNRRFFEEELIHLDTPDNFPLTLVLLDVNGLKLINDAFGHQLGDKVLTKIAQLIKSQCRWADVIARTGGDEFVLLLPRTAEREAEQIVKRIQDVIHKEKVESIQLSVSSGWGTKKDKQEDMMNVFKTAEDNMYRRKLSESSSMRHKTITVILKTLYEKNQREEAHSKRVSAICGKIGRALHLNDDIISELETVGLMHDIGKIAISDEILNKPSILSYDEWMEIKRHPEIGYNILRSISEYGMLAEYVLAHQERWDGKGYPKGLKGTEIPFFARIVAIADSYDAMTGFRPYSEPVTREIAFNEIKRKAGIQFDPDIVWLLGPEGEVFS